MTALKDSAEASIHFLPPPLKSFQIRNTKKRIRGLILMDVVTKGNGSERSSSRDLKDDESDERRREGPDNGSKRRSSITWLGASAGNVHTGQIKKIPNTAEGADGTNEDVQSATIS